MQFSVHPVNPKLDKHKVNNQIDQVSKPTNVTYSGKTLCPAIFNHVLRNSWKANVPWHRLHSNKYLQQHSFSSRDVICNENVVQGIKQ